MKISIVLMMDYAIRHKKTAKNAKGFIWRSAPFVSADFTTTINWPFPVESVAGSVVEIKGTVFSIETAVFNPADGKIKLTSPVYRATVSYDQLGKILEVENHDAPEALLNGTLLKDGWRTVSKKDVIQEVADYLSRPTQRK